MCLKMAAWLAVIALAFLLHKSSSLHFEVNSPYQLVSAEGPYTFLCQADVPLAGCQVKYLRTNKVFDLSEGRRSPHYWGYGLEKGDCGFVMNWTKEWDFPFGCRARTHNGVWMYALTDLERTGRSSVKVLSLNSYPRTLVVNEGSDVTLSFQAFEPLWSCIFEGPGEHSQDNNATYSIDATRFSLGRCDIKLFNVQSRWSGIIKSHLRSAKNSEIVNRPLTTLIVKLAPSAPALTINHDDGVYNEGDLMEASCVVGPARPLARVSWLLDGIVIPGEAEDFSNWPWEYEAARTTRTLRRKLSVDDNGRVLTCRVHHIALLERVADKRKTICVRRAKDFTVVWVIIGIGGSLLFVAVLVAALLIYARATKKWCFMRSGNGVDRESAIYDDVMDLRSNPYHPKLDAEQRPESESFTEMP